MLITDIAQISKIKPVKVLFDMDGTCVEFGAGEKELIKSNKPDLYKNKRPLKTMLKIMKRLSKMKNVEIGILSNCYFAEQREDKIFWLRKYAKFIKPENINIIVYNEFDFKPEDKHFLKAYYIKDHFNMINYDIFLIEDNHKIIKATNEFFGKTIAHHLTELIK